MFKGKKIILGITGSIAAYKSIFLTRLLVSEGAEVKVILTPSAKDFVSPLTLATLSKNKVLSQLSEEDTWANHAIMGRWADAMIIAPLSCNTLAKMANGICDNLLLATYLSATCPVIVAPAMDEDMWHHPSTMRNIERIGEFGNSVISVTKGELASGLFGEGRMAEPDAIVTYLEENVFRLAHLKGKTALVTAGPTYETIDPVRFIANHSSGKMGIAIAETLYMQGASVELVCGPIKLTTKYKGIKVRSVTSADEMLQACLDYFTGADITVMAAAVADYKPAKRSSQKIKKVDAAFNLPLEKTTDILYTLGSIKTKDQLLVGFALETNDEKQNALRKLKEKNADFIVLNSMNDPDAGFGKETNKVTIFDKDMNEYSFAAKDKNLVAQDIVEIITRKLNERL